MSDAVIAMGQNQTVPLNPAQRMWRWRVFAATWLCYAGMYFCRKPFYITKSTLGEQLRFDATMLGTIGATYLVAYTIGQFVAGWFGTRLGPRLLLLFGMGISIATNLVFGIANGPATFIVFMALNGLAQATGWSATVGTMANWFHRGERGTVMGIWATNFQVGGVAANALAAWALGTLGFRYSYFLGSAVLLAVWAFFFFNQRNRPEDVGLKAIGGSDETADGSAAGTATGWSKTVITNVILVGVFYFFVKFIRYALWSWAPFFLSRNFQMSGGNAGYLSTLFDLFGIVGVIVTGFLSDRLFKSRRAGISLIMILVMTASCLLLYTVGRFSIPIFAVSLALIGFSLYGPDALLTGAGAMDIGSRRGAVLAAGIINGMGSIGSVVQELVIGSLYDSSAGALGPIFMVLFGAAGLAALMLVIVVMRNRMGISDV